LADTGDDIRVGTVIANTYEVTRLIGKGGMGTVWEANHRRLPGKRVAIKVLHTNTHEDKEPILRFRREAEIASRLGHPNIIEIHDFNELPSGAPYLVLELLEGEGLDACIRRGPLPLSLIMDIVRQVGSALHTAHRENIIHRDLKPQNIFLLASRGDTTKTWAKLLDFGISKVRGSQTIETQESTMLGTPQYMAPEQAVGNHAAVDASTDVFALGCIVYEMLSGRAAFEGKTVPEVVFKVVYEEPPPLRDLCPNVGADIAQVVARAMAKQQKDRFEDVNAFVKALTGTPLTERARPKHIAPTFATQPGAATADTILSGKTVSPLKKSSRGKTAIGVSAVAALAAAGVVFMMNMEPQTTPIRPTPVAQPTALPQPDPKPEPLPKPERIALTFAVQPADAEILLDGVLLTSGEFTADKDDKPHTLLVRAPGYRPHQSNVSFAMNQAIPISLEKIPAPRTSRKPRQTGTKPNTRIDDDSPYE
jgi:serine/threonine protein kinase